MVDDDKIKFPELSKFMQESTNDLDPNLLLTDALDNLSNVVILGWGNDVHETMYFSSSTGDRREILLLLELAKKTIIDKMFTST